MHPDSTIYNPSGVYKNCEGVCLAQTLSMLYPDMAVEEILIREYTKDSHSVGFCKNWILWLDMMIPFRALASIVEGKFETGDT